MRKLKKDHRQKRYKVIPYNKKTTKATLAWKHGGLMLQLPSPLGALITGTL